MISRIFLAFGGLIGGLGIGFLLLSHSSLASGIGLRFSPLGSGKGLPTVIGFMPYWLLDKMQSDYKGEVTELAYFDLTIGDDGHIVKLQNNGQENEPGWNALVSGKVSEKLTAAKKLGQNSSVVVFSSDNDTISTLVSDPVAHADALISDVAPLMKQYGFTDLNLDVESTVYTSDSARLQFLQFVGQLKHDLNVQKLGTLTVEMSPTDLLQKRLIDKERIGMIADRVVIMAYDYHYPGSQVTGAVAPLFGAGVVSEYDTQAAISIALKTIPKEKLVLGIPDYGYGWETIDPSTRAAIIPGTGIVASSQYISDLLSKCSTCSARFDDIAEEPYIIYKDTDTGTYHQLFYPDARATSAKVAFIKKSGIRGLAIWALGYEDRTVLKPLETYLQ